MLMPPCELHHPQTIEEAMALARDLNGRGEAFDWVAGGTDIIPNYKWRINTKPHIISLASVEGATLLTSTTIGCMVRISDIEHSNVVHPLLRQAASKIASSLIRKSATIGGNLCLDTRCFWYNQGEDWRRSIDWCHKADCGTGADCRVIPNQNTLCVATYQGDLAPNLMVLDAEVVLLGPNGERRMLLSDFFMLDGMKKNVLEQGELLWQVIIPETSMDKVGSYQKLRVRESWDFPEAGIASAWLPGDYSSLQVASTALESIPRLHSDLVEQHLRQNNGIEFSVFSDEMYKEIKPVNNTALPPRYRRSMIRTLTKRSLKLTIGDGI
ncbi:MAG: FAD binding domain-containing protein [archaeon]|nr:FAD binding domain-containing protein [archaeon]